jgi:hypothetical protein
VGVHPEDTPLPVRPRVRPRRGVTDAVLFEGLSGDIENPAPPGVARLFGPGDLGDCASYGA